MLIRPELEADFAAAAALISAAFEGAEHSDGNEAELVAALRRDAAYIPELALTAEMDGRPAGYTEVDAEAIVYIGMDSEFEKYLEILSSLNGGDAPDGKEGKGGKGRKEDRNILSFPSGK